jgi:hypothetical protein
VWNLEIIMIDGPPPVEKKPGRGKLATDGFPGAGSASGKDGRQRQAETPRRFTRWHRQQEQLQLI